MSLLKHLDAEGHIVDDESSSDAALPPRSPERTEAEQALSAALDRMEDGFAVALRKAQQRAEEAEAALADLQGKHDELVAREAENARKLEILAELREKLQSV